MGFVDWLKQTTGRVGDWLHQNIGKPLASGVSWVNQNIVKPVSGLASNVLPGKLGMLAGLAGKAGDVIENVTQGAIGDKRKIDVIGALDTGRKVYEEYQQNKGALKQAMKPMTSALDSVGRKRVRVGQV